ncbi:hypothetical protein TNCV_1527141 [Trichonephila clavipes]|nr:hypothetical protein TNCV_1527141 [Trichonephila clavipes]
MQKVTPARAPLMRSPFSLMSKSFCFSSTSSKVLVRVLAAPARETAWFWLHATTAILTVRCPQRYFPWRPEENLETYKKTEQTRTIRQINKDVTYHNFAELDIFSIM